MKKTKKRYIVLVAGLIGVLAGCQKIPQDVLENSGEINLGKNETVADMSEEANQNSQETGVTERAKADSQETGVSERKKQGSQETDIPEHATLSYEGDGYTLNMDCDVIYAQSSVLTGTLKETPISLKAATTVLNPNETWTEQDGNYYVFKPESERTEDTIDYLYGITVNENTGKGMNYSENTGNYADGTNCKSQDEWTEEMKNYRDECVRYAQNVLSDLDLNYMVSGEELWCTEGEPLSMTLELVLKIHDVPAFDFTGFRPEGILNVAGSMNLKPDQMGGMWIPANYTVATSEDASLMPWEDVLTCLKTQVEQGETRQMLKDIQISKIQLEYLVHDDLTYVPVWTFYNTANDLETPMTCINACTGEVEFEW